MPTIPCPRCRGPIHYAVTGPTSESIEVAATDGINRLMVHVELNQMDVRRHVASCYPDGDGEPLPLFAEVAA